jgi:hypothetical protein
MVPAKLRLLHTKHSDCKDKPTAFTYVNAMNRSIFRLMTSAIKCENGNVPEAPYRVRCHIAHCNGDHMIARTLLHTLGSRQSIVHAWG